MHGRSPASGATGWKVASSWGVERTDFAFDADSLDVLADAVLAVGRYELAARRSQTFNLVVAYRGHREADAESLAALAGRLCARYEERLGASPGSLGLVVLYVVLRVRSRRSRDAVSFSRRP